MKGVSELPFIMTQYILAYIHPISVALQSKICELVLAHTQSRSLIALIETE